MKSVNEICKVTWNYVCDHICLSMYSEICEVIHYMAALI